MPRGFSLALAIWSALLGPVLALAQESEIGASEEVEHHEHLVAFFVGGAQVGPRDNGFAVGIEYERRISARFGLGALAEHTFGDIDAWVYALPFAYHRGPWKLYVGPGVEDGEHGSEPLLRLGGEHAGFEVGEWEIAPQISVDLVHDEGTWVLGVVFGKGL